MTGTALPRKSRISRSRLPSNMPSMSGRMLPTIVGHGNADKPATPSVTIVRNGPDSSDMML
ncbi:hypothetical protein D3C87_2194240 [compost metagenome]